MMWFGLVNPKVAPSKSDYGKIELIKYGPVLGYNVFE